MCRQHHLRTDVSLLYSQGTSLAPVPVSYRHARRFLPYPTRMRVIGHVRDVLRPGITKEKTRQLPHFLPGMFRFYFLRDVYTIKSPSTTFCAKNRCQWM